MTYKIENRLWRSVALGGIGAMWILIVIKTVLVAQNEPGSFVEPYFGLMLLDTWQAHFNFDLLIHCLLLSGWVAYQQRSIFWIVFFAVFTIALGALFSFLYLWIAIWRDNFKRPASSA